MSILSTNVDQKSLETEFSIAICRPNGDKWQSKTLFIVIFDPRSSIVKSVFDCRLPFMVHVHSKYLLLTRVCSVESPVIKLHTWSNDSEYQHGPKKKKMKTLKMLCYKMELILNCIHVLSCQPRVTVT